MITFTKPLYFLILFLLPIYLIFEKNNFFQKNRFHLTLGDWKGIQFNWVSLSQKSIQTFVMFLQVLVFVFLVACLAGPSRFVQEKIYTGVGSGIIFAIDVSPSMTATDFNGESRIKIAKDKIKSFVNKRGGDSFGLVAFGSEAALIIPPTTDHEVFLTRLNDLVIGEFGDGTAIGMGLAVAAAHIKNFEYTNKSVILLTDGENNAGEINPITAAKLFDDSGVELFVAGIGSKGSVPVDYLDPNTGTRFVGMLESDFNEKSLKEIANAAKGYYVNVVDFKTLDYVFSLADDLVPQNSSAFISTKLVHLEKYFILIICFAVIVVWVLKRVVLRSVLC